MSVSSAENANFLLHSTCRDVKSKSRGGASFPCLQMEVFNLSEKEAFDKFLEEKDKMVKIPFSEREVHYACHKKIGIAVSTLGASRAIALGAYSFALSQLNIL